MSRMIFWSRLLNILILVCCMAVAVAVANWQTRPEGVHRIVTKGKPVHVIVELPNGEQWSGWIRRVTHIEE